MKDAGMTLLELVMVMVVIGGLTIITGPPLAQHLRSSMTRTATDEFRLAHSLARSTALRYGRVAELHIDAANAQFWVEVDTSGTGVRDTVGFLHKPGNGKLTMKSTRSLLCFDARGLATTRAACESADATIVFAMAGRTNTVQITPLGKVLR